MKGATSVSGPVSGTTKTLTFETGLLAHQSQGAVVGQIGDTMVLATANAASGVREGIDFFPLTVDVEERMYAAGRIPGSFFRREGRPSDAAILTCRLIDRPLRPSFADGFRNETQVVITVLGADQENPHDVVAINAASAALMVSGIPFEGPIGAVRIAYTAEGEWLAHPSYQEGDASAFELVVAGRKLDNGDVAIMMVEAGGTEAAWEMYQNGVPKVTEEAIADGLEAAKTWIRESVDLQLQLVAEAGSRSPLAWSPQRDYQGDVAARVAEIGRAAVEAVTAVVTKAERAKATEEATAAIMGELAGEFAGRESEIKAAIRSLTKQLVRERIAASGERIDGRGPTEIRPLSAEVALIPTAHGSGLFRRGDTQVLNVTTLGMPRMDQLLDTLGVDDKKRYMHHYNMPPSANGETGRVGSPKRREIGHGLLAERALLPVVPPVEEFPYALRLVSEVLASNGSTSMASVCGSSLSLMDAGVPIKAPVAGIAMGLVKVGDDYITLTDILGAEDAFGDMDFKVAGTSEFVTALQLDTKIDGLPAEVLAAALLQAKAARLAILDVMHDTLPASRAEVSDTAPKIVSIEIPIDKIGEVIGPKGKVINALQQETGADINVDDDGMVGTVTIGSKDGGAVSEALRRIELILDPPKAEVGAVYRGRVVNITKFGAFVNILPGRDGLVHISKLGRGKRIDKVEDVVDLGDEIEVHVDDIDPQGKVSLSLAGDAPPANGTGGEPEPVAATTAASFEDSWEAEATATFGDLGPAEAPAGAGAGAGGGDRGPRRTRAAGASDAGSAVTLGKSVLDEGLTVVTERMADARSVTMGFWVGTGSVDEPGALWGASHFLEHLLFKGTDSRTARDISEAVDAVGGDLNAFTTKEYTAFYVRLLAGDAELGLDILSEILWSPAFRPEEIESERQVILEEILMHADEPADLVHEVLGEALWPGHTLGREVIGEDRTILAMTREQISAFHAEHYRPANVVFAAAGALDHDDVVAGVARRLGQQRGGVSPARDTPPAGPGGSLTRSRTTEQAHVAVGIAALARDDERRYALAVLDHVLGGGMSSRLFQAIREERGLAYSVYSYRLAFERAGAFAVYAGTSPSNVPEVLGLVHEELDRMAADGISAGELEAARSHLRGSLVLGLEDSGSRMSRIGHAQLVHGRVPTLDEIERHFAAVTVADVGALAREILGGSRIVAVVGPFDDESVAAT